MTMSGKTVVLAALSVLMGCLGWGGAAWSQPPLPEGLAPAQDASPARATSPQPPLPEGLGGTAPSFSPSASSSPPLPEGLGSASSPVTPALPQGLDSAQGNAPSLPEGLDASPSVESRASAPGPEDQEPAWWHSLVDRHNWHGFFDNRFGLRVRRDDAMDRDATLAESRLQLKTRQALSSRLTLDFTGDLLLDGVMERAETDLRQLRLTWTPVDVLDIRLGRQPLAWGVGDLLFINDLFPKDWNSFFIGRDVEYLKAPSDAVKVGWFPGPFNVEVVYTPQFDSDRYISGDRISYYNPIAGGRTGNGKALRALKPSGWFEDDEWALRVSRNFGATEVALYGYDGYWKSPGGTRLLFPPAAVFPRLRVWGASARGPLGKGIFSTEVGYYDSLEDRAGDDPFVNNGEFRLLLGYEQEIARELTGGVQYYLEHMMDYGAYRRTLPWFVPSRDEDRHVVTFRLTKLLMNQTLTLSMFLYYSPSDQDAYLRPAIRYAVNDHWTVDAGANLFLGNEPYTFFGQFENNTNIYVGMQYGF
ncbi:MAG TPA: hypothetical protein PK379_06805 [Candidatus Hydrogenedentes bacterium]|nr:hypothetical protein [Candidatus Hydrogenedentota bacterium]